MQGGAVGLLLFAALYCSIPEDERCQVTGKVGGSQTVMLFWVSVLAFLVGLVKPSQCACIEGAHCFAHWGVDVGCIHVGGSGLAGSPNAYLDSVFASGLCVPVWVHVYGINVCVVPDGFDNAGVKVAC